MSDEKILVTFEEAVTLLPERSRRIHTYRQVGPILVGADHDRADLLKDMQAAPTIEVGGKGCQTMNHAVVIFDDHGPLFIETAWRDWEEWEANRAKVDENEIDDTV